MPPIARNIIAVVVGIIVGGIVNYGAIVLGSLLIDPPAGVDVSDAASIASNIDSYEPIHFLPPFLGHALGTLIGAILAARIAATRKMTMALVIGVFFLLGAIYMVLQVGGPMWFMAVDLLLAYLPMAALGGKIGGA